MYEGCPSLLNYALYRNCVTRVDRTDFKRSHNFEREILKRDPGSFMITVSKVRWSLIHSRRWVHRSRSVVLVVLSEVWQVQTRVRQDSTFIGCRVKFRRSELGVRRDPRSEGGPRKLAACHVLSREGKQETTRFRFHFRKHSQTRCSWMRNKTRESTVNSELTLKSNKNHVYDELWMRNSGVVLAFFDDDHRSNRRVVKNKRQAFQKEESCHSTFA